MTRRKIKDLHWKDTNLNQLAKVYKVDKIPFESEMEEYTKFYEVVTALEEKPLLYLKSGHPEAPKEIVPVYLNGIGHSGYETTIAEAVKLAVRDAIYLMKK